MPANVPSSPLPFRASIDDPGGLHSGTTPSPKTPSPVLAPSLPIADRDLPSTSAAPDAIPRNDAVAVAEKRTRRLQGRPADVADGGESARMQDPAGPVHGEQAEHERAEQDQRKDAPALEPAPLRGTPG